MSLRSLGLLLRIHDATFRAPSWGAIPRPPRALAGRTGVRKPAARAVPARAGACPSLLPLPPRPSCAPNLANLHVNLFFHAYRPTTTTAPRQSRTASFTRASFTHAVAHRPFPSRLEYSTPTASCIHALPPSWRARRRGKCPAPISTFPQLPYAGGARIAAYGPGFLPCIFAANRRGKNAGRSATVAQYPPPRRQTTAL